MNHITVVLDNHLFKTKFLHQDKDSLYMIIEIYLLSLSTIVLDLSLQSIKTLLFAINIIQNITRTLLRLHNKTEPISFDSSRSYTPLPIVNLVVDNLEEVFQTACLDNTITDDQIFKYCNYFHFRILKTTNLIKETQPNIGWYNPLKTQ